MTSSDDFIRRFEYFINLSDADLTLRTDAELRAFFTRFHGRSVMSIVQRKKDPRRYKMHEGFRGYCWTECANGSAARSNVPFFAVPQLAPCTSSGRALWLWGSSALPE